MTKKLSLFAAPLAALALAACGSSSHSSSATSSAAAPTSSSSATATATATSSATSSSPAPATSSTSSAAAAAPSGAVTKLALAANPHGLLKYNTKALKAKAGKVEITFTNDSPLPHNVTVQKGTSGPSLGATPTFSHGTKTLTVTLKAGTYTYYCSVPGHRQAGMLGTLTVS